MKNLFLSVMLFLLLAFNSYAGDRMVIIERFTSWTCGPCASNNPALNAFLNSVDYDKIVNISYHMNWPAPGNDGFYLYNPTDNNARRNFYGINSIPQGRMDGIVQVQPPYTQSGLQALFDSRTNILSPITVILTDSVFADSIKVKARIYCEVNLPNPTVNIHFAIIEKLKSYQSPPGTNGETQFHNVMRRMVNAGNGYQVNLYPGQTLNIEHTFYYDPIWDPVQVMPMLFVQNVTEILNSAKKTANFTLIPNSPHKSVQQGVPQSATYDFQIPVVVTGYNSPITLTAEVVPPTSGVTVSFPNGNTITSFPANFTVQVNSTGSVPTGAYRIIVTGTNTNNKVHKTSVSYLVGKNYIVIGANRPNLQFAVNGQTYTNIASFEWNIGSTQTIAAISPQTFGSVRYRFLNWSNNGDSNQTITVNTNTSSYIVNYKTQFRLLTAAQPNGIPVTLTGGNQFYDTASTVNFSVSPLTVTFNGKQYYFQRWNGSGPGSYTGTNPNGQISSMNGVIVQTAVFDTILPFGITNLNTGVPKEFSLEQNYPNPFNPVTNIKFAIPKSSDVKIRVYDIIGNEVAVIYSGYLYAGYYIADFNASGLASGVYFYKLEADNFSSVKRMVLVK